MKQFKKEIIICNCHSTEHQLVMLYEEDEIEGKTYPMCYFHIHLNERPFWQRLKYGISYIFGRKSKYGAFDEFIFNQQDADKLQDLVDYLKKKEIS